MDFILCWIGLKEFSRHWFYFISSSDAISRSTAGLNTFAPIIKLNIKLCIRARNLVIHRCEISKSVWWFNIDRCSKYLSWINAYLDHKMLIMRMSRYLTLMNLSFIIYLDMSITELIFWHIEHLAIRLEKINFKRPMFVDVKVHSLDKSVQPVYETGLTGFQDRSDRLWNRSNCFFAENTKSAMVSQNHNTTEDSVWRKSFIDYQQSSSCIKVWHFTFSYILMMSMPSRCQRFGLDNN